MGQDQVNIGDSVNEEDNLVLWPSTADSAYVTARRSLLRRERELYDLAESVAAERRALPGGATVDEYVFRECSVDPARGETPVDTALSGLFGPHDTLVVYHLMFEPGNGEACPMCSMWVDGFQGVAPHLARHTAFAIVAKAGVDELRAWGTRRGWDGLRLLSSLENTFNHDFGVENKDCEQAPGVSVFVREGSVVRHHYSARPELSPTRSERGIDLLSPVWQVLDLLPTGRGGWYAENSYVDQT